MPNEDSVFQNNVWEDFDIYITGGVSSCNNEVRNVSLTKYQLYYYNKSVDLKDIYAGAIYLCNADNSTVMNATVAADGRNSISNYYVENVTYTNITTSGLREAIFFKYSANNNITNILMKDGWSGISYSTNTNNTNFKNATIYNMTDRAIRMYAGASRNTISDSKIYNNSVGIYLNTAGKYGPNRIYNSFFNNIHNLEWGVSDFFGDGSVYLNYWNTTRQFGTNIIGGPSLGGNFWGYPNGTGFSQTCTDGNNDGICDATYTLKSNNIDYLPLAYNSAIGPVHNINKGSNYATIQAAINDASPGDEIHVDSGMYYENVNVSKQLILHGIGMPVVNAGGSGSAITLVADGIVLEGFNATNASTGISVFSNNNMLSDNDATSNLWEEYQTTIGIVLNGSSNNTLIGNYASSNNEWQGFPVNSNTLGIYLIDSSYNMIINNSAVGNRGQYSKGIVLINSSNNILINNDASFNYGYLKGIGITLGGSNNNTLIGNKVKDNSGSDAGDGIVFYGSSNNTLRKNNISNNRCVIDMYYSDNNILFDNIFNNYDNDRYRCGWGINTWNTTRQSDTNIIGGSYIGGNFWEKSDGTGFSQTCTDTDGDGICDSAYVLDSNNIDYLPLALPDTTPPTVIGSTPTGTNVPVTTQITVTFNESMNQSSAQTAFSTLPATTGSITWNGNMMTYSPGSNLDDNTTYTVTVGTSAKDLAGNSLQLPYNWSFTTASAPDTSPPIVIGSTPTGTGVPVTTQVTVTFNESMNQPSAQTAFSTSPATSGSFSWGGNMMIYTPGSNLLANTTYNVTVGTGTKDLAGNSLQFPYNWSFTTGALPSIEERLAALEADMTALKTRVTVLETENTALKNVLVGVSRNGTDLYIDGANLHIRDGSGDTEGPVNGLGNLIIGYNELRDYEENDRTGSHNLVLGSMNNYGSYGGLVAGFWNQISGSYSSVSGGNHNTAGGPGSSVSGGEGNTAVGYSSSVSGGSGNRAYGNRSSVSGGWMNTASGDTSSVSGGHNNGASGPESSISGGLYNTASGFYSSVSGGESNTASGGYSWVSGGHYNRASEQYSLVSGGRYNTASGYFSSVSGGGHNIASSWLSSVSGGYNNTASGSSSSVSGGYQRNATGMNNWVAGGLFQDH